MFIELESLVTISVISTRNATIWRVCGVQWHPKALKVTPESLAFLFYLPRPFSTFLIACCIALSSLPETG